MDKQPGAINATVTILDWLLRASYHVSGGPVISKPIGFADIATAESSITHSKSPTQRVTRFRCHNKPKLLRLCGRKYGPGNIIQTIPFSVTSHKDLSLVQMLLGRASPRDAASRGQYQTDSSCFAPSPPTTSPLGIAAQKAVTHGPIQKPTPSSCSQLLRNRSPFSIRPHGHRFSSRISG